ncbi:restriction endonuclease subunit S [Agarilytica rhodophyticola]|uniref:restriction endonuclease subunit S n=1 Tax=Agarilytica rhodophyticola TaxID=1737490 RepID=UPI000B349C79|nr:restriction endonuclease subunit S [Agarilytica rhodophyticola]
MSELPEGWASTTVDAFIQSMIGGASPKREDYSNNGVLALNKGDIKSRGKLSIKTNPKMLPQEYVENHINKLIDYNDIVVTLRDLSQKADFLGLIARYKNNEKAIITQGMYKLNISTECSGDYLIHFSNSPFYRELVKAEKVGVTQVHLRNDQFRGIEIPLPPLNEQTRIANKLDSLLAKVDAAQARLERIPTLLKRFRQSVLAAATSGELTREWRERDVVDFAMKEIKSLKEKKSMLSIKKPKEPLPAPNIDYEDIPEQWAYSDITPFLDVERAGLKTGPFGSLLKKSDHQAAGIPVIGIENIAKTGFRHGSKIHISLSKANELDGYDLKPGDILISRSGTVGETCVVPENIGNARFSTNIMRLSFFPGSINSMYFRFLFLGSRVVLKQVNELCKGSTRLFLNQKILSSIRYPIPPIEEQKEIVRRVESLFAMADTIEKQYHQAKQRIDRLTQSILAKAFRGELVPQDPNDEPASELLKRIQAEREQKKAKPARKRCKQDSHHEFELFEDFNM